MGGCLGFPAELRTVLAKMVAREPARRYQTPAEVAAALVPFIKKATGAEPPPVSVSAPPAGKRTDRAMAAEPAAPARRWPPPPLWIGGGVLAALLVAGMVLLRANPGRQPMVANRGDRPAVGDVARPSANVPEPPVAEQPEARAPTYTGAIGMEFVLVPKGKSWLNGGGGKPGDKEVKIAHGFYLGKYEVTQAQWTKMQGNQHLLSSRQRSEMRNITDQELARFPIENVTCGDVEAFLAQLNKRDKKPGWTYRLPRSNEWEYACRGGPMRDRLQSTFDFYLEKPIKLVPNSSNNTERLQPEQANFMDVLKALNRPCKVGSYKPNKLGLYDMHGNVAEWRENDEGDHTNHRVCRGGSWGSKAGDCRAASGMGSVYGVRANFIGCRVARVWDGGAGQ